MDHLKVPTTTWSLSFSLSVLSGLSCRAMSQESFLYSFVPRGMMVLAKYTEFTRNFLAIAAQCLQKLLSSNNKFTYNCDHHTFNFIVEDGYAYYVVAKESVSKKISIAFLERVKADFKKRYDGGKADTAITISNNYMTHHIKVLLLGHSDSYEEDKNMQVTIAFNHFGEELGGRMSRCRYRYFHVVNND